MELIEFSHQNDLVSAAHVLKSFFLKSLPQNEADMCLHISFPSGNYFSVIKNSSIRPKFFYQTKNGQSTFIGIGIADIVYELSDACMRAQSQMYFGGLRFCDSVAHSSEWQSFGRAFFIKPIALIVTTAEKSTFTLSFCGLAKIPFKQWLHQVYEILNAVINGLQLSNMMPSILSFELNPDQPNYLSNVNKAVSIIRSGTAYKKIVLGRRRKIFFSDALKNPCLIFEQLLAGPLNQARFFIDNGSACFFGRSPELLYRRKGNKIFSEAIAGTRPRGASDDEDKYMAHELLNNAKDLHEHRQVCEHIENKLKLLKIEFISGELKILALPFVQHLYQSYEGELSSDITDEKIIAALHPTPAVSGVEAKWALSLIRELEGFDRGFYGGIIGFLSADEAEFTVAIRSALVHEQTIFTYAACGIVADSIPELEWAELEHKEKAMLSAIKLGLKNE